MRVSGTLTSSATPHLTGGIPDGTETIDQTNIQSLRRDLTNIGGQRPTLHRIEPQREDSP
jgi:hypothetical protein